MSSLFYFILSVAYHSLCLQGRVTTGLGPSVVPGISWITLLRTKGLIQFQKNLTVKPWPSYSFREKFESQHGAKPDGPPPRSPGSPDSSGFCVSVSGWEVFKKVIPRKASQPCSSLSCNPCPRPALASAPASGLVLQLASCPAPPEAGSHRD